MLRSSRFTIYRNILFWLGLALLVGLFYLVVCAWGFGHLGFPLDDAWIHQTYARNLASSGQLAFVPGVPSAGSTAPLWSVLLSIGYLLGAPPKIWTYGLGLTCLGLTGWTIKRLAERLFPKLPRLGLGVGLFCVFEWHLVWAAVSGMETILFVWLSIVGVERYLAVSEDQSSHTFFRPYVGLGALGGLLTLTRPEGLALLALIGLDAAYRWWRQAPPKRLATLLARWTALALGLALLLGPYLLFHLTLTGQPFPNTFYAKQAEYDLILQNFPLWWRLFGNLGPTPESVQGVLRVIFIGPQILLLPGLAFAVWLTLRERRAELALIWLWGVGFLLLYAVRLPVTYQHGRYQIPAIPWVILLGVWGTARLLNLPVNPARRRVLRFLRQAVWLSLIVLVLAFLMLGAQAYGRDVRFIENEMVATARWLNDHVAPDALIAAHDIGAIGYYARRPLIDLAGLVTPEIIPIIRDETALFDFVVSRRADYLVTFPSWYPTLTQHPSLVLCYETEALSTRLAGSDNMVVYQIGSEQAGDCQP